MKTSEINAVTGNLKGKLTGKRGILKVSLVTFAVLIFSTGVSFAHCDTMDGPVIKDSRIAIEKNNINYVLKWIQREDEKELKDAFLLTMKVRKLGPDAKILADKYFFETLVRLHRSGEGVPFTGLKPSGTPIDEKVLAADKSLETGNLTQLKAMIPGEKIAELEERYMKAVALKNFDVNNVEAGRKYVGAYVQFFKFAEGGEGHSDVHQEKADPVHQH